MTFQFRVTVIHSCEGMSVATFGAISEGAELRDEESVIASLVMVNQGPKERDP